MAIKVGDRYFAGLIVHPGQQEDYGPELTDIRDGGYGRWMYCKYCYKYVRPVASYENIRRLTRQALCSGCGAGLTPPEDVG